MAENAPEDNRPDHVTAEEPELVITYRSTAELVPYAGNAKVHPESQIDALDGSMGEFGFTNPILTHGNTILAGHARLEAAQQAGRARVPTIDLGYLTALQAQAYPLTDNRLAELATYDFAILAQEWDALSLAGFDTSLTGFTAEDRLNFDGAQTDAGDGAYADGVLGSMIENYGWPPFSVLDSRRGEWLERKRAWMNVIGDHGETRDHTLAAEGSIMEDIGSASILDPVLAEIMVRWFAPAKGTILDPFAGDTVFGFVAGYLGHNFTGIELRQEQCDLNQGRCDEYDLACDYVCDTSENLDAHVEDASVDLVFSCPPYADLEVYSDDAADLSNMPHDEFFAVYARILASTYAKLKDNRFAVITIGEVRSKSGNGNYISLVPKTIEIMHQAGYAYYNELILVNSAGTLPLRAGKSMLASRKIGKQHQNVLVFVKGSPQAAAHDFGNVVGDLAFDPAAEDAD